jgi:ribosomal protein S27AE
MAEKIQAQYRILKAIPRLGPDVNPKHLACLTGLTLEQTRQALRFARNTGRLTLKYEQGSKLLHIAITDLGRAYVKNIENPPAKEKIKRHISKPKAEKAEKIKKKLRECLQCNKDFLSSHIGERICGLCKVNGDWKSGSYLHPYPDSKIGSKRPQQE